MAQTLGLETLLDGEPSRQRDLVTAMIVGLQPASKLATSRLFDTTSLGDSLGAPRWQSCSR